MSLLDTILSQKSKDRSQKYWPTISWINEFEDKIFPAVGGDNTGVETYADVEGGNTTGVDDHVSDTEINNTKEQEDVATFAGAVGEDPSYQLPNNFKKKKSTKILIV